MEIYIVKHMYDTDGGFGDAIPQEETVAVFSDRETAEKYVDSFEIKEATVYDTPYADLTFGTFEIEAVRVFDKDEFPQEGEAMLHGYNFCKRWYENSLKYKEI